MDVVHLKSCITGDTIKEAGKEVGLTSLRFKIDVLEALKEKGYTSYVLRKDNLLSQSTIQKLREVKGVGWENLDRLCGLLDCQPGDLLEYVRDLD